MTTELTPERIEKLKSMAALETTWEKINKDPMTCLLDYCGENYDDAFSLGTKTGKICLARAILEELGISWT